MWKLIMKGYALGWLLDHCKRLHFEGFRHIESLEIIHKVKHVQNIGMSIFQRLSRKWGKCI